jgi:hypothetical protein
MSKWFMGRRQIWVAWAAGGVLLIADEGSHVLRVFTLQVFNLPRG